MSKNSRKAETNERYGDFPSIISIISSVLLSYKRDDEQLRLGDISASQGKHIAQYNYMVHLSNTNQPFFKYYYDLDKIYLAGWGFGFKNNGDIGAQNKLQNYRKKIKN